MWAMNKLVNIVLVVDDGGFPFSNGDYGNSIDIEPYEHLLELAKMHSTVIPIDITAGYLDIDRISNPKIVNKNAEKIVKLLRENTDSLPVWNHGLTHSFKGLPTEFLFYDSPEKIPESIQQEHLELSQKIFEYLELGRPAVFVPPGHAWEAGVTDRIAKNLGFKAIAVRQFEKTPLKQWIRAPGKSYNQVWKKSEYIDTYWRLGVGISSLKRRINKYDVWKSFKYIQPPNRLVNYAVNRSWKRPQAPHHFFAHIQNFCNTGSIKHWSNIIKKLVQSQKERRFEK